MISAPLKDLWDGPGRPRLKTPIRLSFIKFLMVGILLISPFGQVWANSPNSKDSTDLTLAVISDSSGISSGTLDGLRKLSWETRQRTSINPSLQHEVLSILSDDIYRYPFALWRPGQPVDADSALLASKLRRYLTTGGTLLVDIQEAEPRGPIFQSLSTLLARALPKAPLKPVEREHVFFKTFYLVDQLGGRFNHSTYLLGVELDGRMALMLHPNDLLGALAQDANDDWLYYAALGERGREYALRVGVNAFMYTLCLDYKQDQVHIPFILKRRR